MDLWVLLEPGLALLVGVEIVEDDVQFTIREGLDDALHEAEELDTAPPLRMLRNDLSGRDLERCKQSRGAVPPVVMALAGQGTSVRQFQIALRPFQRLDRRLFVDAQNDRLGRRVNVETDHVGRLGRELGIFALTPGLPRQQIDLVLAQGSAKHIEHQCPPAPLPATAPSSGRSLGEAAYPRAPECACSPPDRISAASLRADYPPARQARDRQNDAAIC